MKNAMTSTAGATTTATPRAIFWTVLVVLAFSAEASAKRGCQAFGHACYGGHGKRSSYLDLPPPPPSDKLLQEQQEFEKTKDEVAVPPEVDYNLLRANFENSELVPPVPAQGYSSLDPLQRSNSVYSQQQQHNRLSLPILLRKLMVPVRRPYMSYSGTHK